MKSHEQRKNRREHLYENQGRTTLVGDHVYRWVDLILEKKLIEGNISQRIDKFVTHGKVCVASFPVC